MNSAIILLFFMTNSENNAVFTQLFKQLHLVLLQDHENTATKLRTFFNECSTRPEIKDFFLKLIDELYGKANEEANDDFSGFGPYNQNETTNTDPNDDLNLNAEEMNLFNVGGRRKKQNKTKRQKSGKTLRRKKSRKINRKTKRKIKVKRTRRIRR